MLFAVLFWCLDKVTVIQNFAKPQIYDYYCCKKLKLPQSPDLILVFYLELSVNIFHSEVLFRFSSLAFEVLDYCFYFFLILLWLPCSVPEFLVLNYFMSFSRNELSSLCFFVFWFMYCTHSLHPHCVRYYFIQVSMSPCFTYGCCSFPVWFYIVSCVEFHFLHSLFVLIVFTCFLLPFFGQSPLRLLCINSPAVGFIALFQC